MRAPSRRPCHTRSLYIIETSGACMQAGFVSLCRPLTTVGNLIKRPDSVQRTPGKLLLAILLCVALLPFAGAVVAQLEPADQPGAVQADTPETLLPNLATSSFKQKTATVEALGQLSDPRLLAIFSDLLEGRLYYVKADKHVISVQRTEQGFAATDPLDGSALGSFVSGDVKKISVNNTLRGTLRGMIARLSLTHPDADQRLAAVQQIISDLDAEKAQLLREQMPNESDAAVKTAMRTGLALANLDSEDRILRLAALEALQGSTYPEVRNRLTRMTELDEQGKAKEPDAEVYAEARAVLKQIEFKLELFALGETVFFGLSLGSVLLLAAIGLAITFGVMGVINMAHGELIMLGAYTTYLVQLAMPNHLEYSLAVAIPAAFLVSGLFGVAIERGVIRFLYGRPLETLLATFGISLILQQLVRTTISAQNVTVSNPDWMSGSWAINPSFALTFNRIYILIFALLVFLGLLLILKKTALGLQVRAVSQNRTMAKAMGIRTDWVDAMTFGLGAGIAGIAGVALSQLTNVGPNMGQAYIIDSFMVVVFGGVGNLWGTLVGAMSLGVANKFLEPYSGAVLAKIFVLVFIIIFIQKRPRGLFPQKGRAAEN